jgi:Ca2+-binding EF-hand superfamily protein
MAGHILNNEQKEKIMKTFAMLDKDGNGTLSKEEII